MEQYDMIGARFEESKSTAAFSAADTFTLAAALGDVSDLAVLDLACGYGYNTRLLAERGARKVLGVDISEEMVRLARAHEARRPLGVEYLVSDVARLPRLEPFGLATAVYLFNYAPSRAALRDMFRAIHANLAAGGRLLAIVPNPAPVPEDDWEVYGVRRLERIPSGEAPLLRMEFLTEPPTPFQHYEWQLADFERAARDAGFAVVGWQPVSPPPPDEERDESFWQVYRERPISSLMTCTA
ncbi:class I SAM-dependent methyltransferase [Streptomyces purpureus]|uniref:class I SAM-dependent methyltransferase n=1 Tax=Streptomyces purpureus TaxID=1951 RepID=UPI00039CC54E|nr:class I SAM-dependent methyltransferase [Streptomyces purpureus]